MKRFIVFASILLASCAGTPDEPLPQSPSYEVTASDMVDQFQENEIRANGVYKGLVVDVTGNVVNVGDGIGGAYVTIGDRPLHTVYCGIDQSQRQTAASLTKG